MPTRNDVTMTDVQGQASNVRRTYARERARLARELHPDRGGDVEQYVAAMTDLEGRYAAALGQRVGEEILVRRTVRGRVTLVRRRLRTVRRAVAQRSSWRRRTRRVR